MHWATLTVICLCQKLKVCSTTRDCFKNCCSERWKSIILVFNSAENWKTMETLFKLQVCQYDHSQQKNISGRTKEQLVFFTVKMPMMRIQWEVFHYWLTFEETVFAVYNIDPPLLRAGCAVHLTVVLVEVPIRTTDRYKGAVTLLLAHALCLACQLPHHTFSAPSTVRCPTQLPIWNREC